MKIILLRTIYHVVFIAALFSLTLYYARYLNTNRLTYLLPGTFSGLTTLIRLWVLSCHVAYLHNHYRGTYLIFKIYFRKLFDVTPCWIVSRADCIENYVSLNAFTLAAILSTLRLGICKETLLHHSFPAHSTALHHLCSCIWVSPIISHWELLSSEISNNSLTMIYPGAFASLSSLIFLFVSLSSWWCHFVPHLLLSGLTLAIHQWRFLRPYSTPHTSCSNCT